MYSIIFLIFAITLIPMLIFAPWVPTRHSDIERIMRLAALKGSDVFYDLGSGDGKVLFGAAKDSPGKFIGIESYVFLYLFSIIKKRMRFRDKDISFRFGDIFSYDLSDATVVYVFGFPGKMDRLSKKLIRECRSGTKIISYSFEIGGLKLLHKDKPSKDLLAIYVYEI